VWVIALSLALALVGVVTGRTILTRVTDVEAPRDPHGYWALGLVTLLPAWLVAFVGLLGSQPVAPRPLAAGVAWVLSAAAMLVGAIATEARARQAGEHAETRDAARLWRLGVLAFLPAWLIALGGHLVR
jgi:hypothetical protein